MKAIRNLSFSVCWDQCFIFLQPRVNFTFTHSAVVGELTYGHADVLRATS